MTSGDRSLSSNSSSPWISSKRVPVFAICVLERYRVQRQAQASPPRRGVRRCRDERVETSARRPENSSVRFLVRVALGPEEAIFFHSLFGTSLILTGKDRS